MVLEGLEAGDCVSFWVFYVESGLKSPGKDGGKLVVIIRRDCREDGEVLATSCFLL